jgi:hypothetical protein
MGVDTFEIRCVVRSNLAGETFSSAARDDAST